MNEKLKKVSTLAEYLDLSPEDRTVRKWFWCGPWYLLPRAMKWELTAILEDGSEWEKTYNFLKKEYPIQYFVRNLDEIFFVKWFNRELYAFNLNYWIPIKCFFKPWNKDLRKLIPNVYKSEDDIIYDVLKQIFLRVYLPNKFENWRGDTYTDHWPKMAKEADEIYAKLQSIPVLESELKSEWDKIPIGSSKKGLSYEEIYGKVNALESLIDQTKTDILIWIVKNRSILDN